MHANFYSFCVDNSVAKSMQNTYYAVLSCLHKGGFLQTIPNFEFWTKKWPFDHEDNGQMDSLSKMVLKDGIRQNPSVIGTHRDLKPNQQKINAFLSLLIMSPKILTLIVKLL